ncbi:MAG: protein-disulfide reductase DsbD family protein [Rhodospirillales bacterium]|jgi:suppressor for copper-sensitivity B|nr:protein-disulfide reductase DsbD family protein [Rhodospirillales bacterium]MDP6774343.1 protein-disulfide reductase DsbD family protein [Rhodospirillales bacterium]
MRLTKPDMGRWQRRAQAPSALFVALALLAGLWPDGVRAAASPWAETEQTALRLVSASQAVGDGDTVVLGLHFRLKKGWKVYWRSPGDAGLPPRADWSGSDNLASASVGWPIPERFSILGFETLGYTGEVVLPVTAEVREPGSPLSLRARVEYLACSNICIPYEADLALDLPAGAARPSAEAHLINRFSVRIPGSGEGHGMAIESAEAGQVGNGTVLRVTAASAIPLREPDLFVEGPAELWFSPPRVRLGEGGGKAVIEVSVEGIADFGRPLAGAALTLTLTDGARAAERTLTVAAATNGGLGGLGGSGDGGAARAEAAGSEAGGTELVLILGLALLGGLILNLMPCVLPVLSIKVLGVIGHGGGEARTVRLGFLATTAGIVFSFMVLATALVALKSAGAAVGWGLQFQHPWFLIAMTLVVALFACNLWGFFEVRLPQWASDMGEHASHVHGLGGHFLSGAFATVLATPCTAPFLGTAVGFALSRGAVEIFAVFAALGVGLALPYLVVAAAPGLATRLPRPGPWMVKVRWILGCALSVTAVWLLTVLARQSGGGPALAVGALTAAAAAALYLRHRMAGMGGAAGAVSAALAVAAFLVPAGDGAGRPWANPGARLDSLWSPFEKAAIRRLVTTGKVVFVDVTADWCLTCQINKSLVLTRGDVYRRLAGDGVVAMQADWTRPDDAISRYLASFGRYGIPFDAVYGPGTPRGEALPELLTENAVLEALERAAGPAAVSSN